MLLLHIFVVSRNLMEKVPEGPISVVADSYDMYHLTDQILGVQLKDEVPGTLLSFLYSVLNVGSEPDSGA